MGVPEQGFVSVIIVYTDLQKLEEAKLWLQKQTVWESVELVALDNRENVFSSAAKALNYGAEMSKGEYLVFMHQDVYLWDLNAIDTYRTYLQVHPDTIIGAAGKPVDGEMITDLWETQEKMERGCRANGKVYEVETLDECMIAMTQQTWRRLLFDEKCCNNWHGYAMDICMANTLAGGQNMMVPLKICHDSLGNSGNKGFRDTVGCLIRKYRKTDIKQIYGTCIQIKCNLRSYYWYRFKEMVKDILKKHGYRYFR